MTECAENKDIIDICVCKYCGVKCDTEKTHDDHLENSRECLCVRNTLFVCRKCYTTIDTLPLLYSHNCECDEKDVFDKISDIFSDKIEELSQIVDKQKNIITRLKNKLKTEREKCKILYTIIQNNIGQIEAKVSQRDEFNLYEKNDLYEKENSYEEEEIYEEDLCEENDEDNCRDEKSAQEIDDTFATTCILSNIQVDVDSGSDISDDSAELILSPDTSSAITDEYIKQNENIMMNGIDDMRSCINYADSVTWVAMCEQLKPNIQLEQKRENPVIRKIIEKRQERHNKVFENAIRHIGKPKFDMVELRLDFSQSMDIYDNELSILMCDPSTHFSKVCEKARVLRDERLRVFLFRGTKEYINTLTEDIDLYMKKVESMEGQTTNENLVLIARNISSFLSNFDQYMVATLIQRNKSSDIRRSNFNRCDCFIKLKPNEKRALFGESIPFPTPDNTLCKEMRRAMWHEFMSKCVPSQEFRAFRRNDFLNIFRQNIIGIKHIHDIIKCYFDASRFCPCIAYVSITEQKHPHAFFVLEKVGQDGKRYWRHDFMLDDICSSVTSEINAIIADILTEFMSVFNSRMLNGSYITADLRTIHRTIVNNLFYTMDMKFFGPILRECIIKNCEHIFTQNDFIINLNLRQTMSTFSFRPSATDLANEFRCSLMRIFTEESVAYKYTESFLTDEQKKEVDIHRAKIAEKWMAIEEIVFDNVDKFLYCFPTIVQHIRDHFGITPQVIAKTLNVINTDNFLAAKKKAEYCDIDDMQISDSMKNKVSNRIAQEYMEKLRHMETSMSRANENIDEIVENMGRRNERNFLRHTLSLYSDYLQQSK